jgi:hypothetical protein
MILFFTVQISIVSAQILKSKYYDVDWNKSDSQNFDIRRDIYKVDSIFLIKDFNKKERLLMTGHYSSIDTLVENGLFQFFNKKGLIESEGCYYNGSMIGEWKFYEKKSKLKRKIDYSIENRVCSIESDRIEVDNNANTQNKAPVFNDGGANSFKLYIFMNLSYPPMALKYYEFADLQVSFIVDSDGSVCNVNTIGYAHKDIISEVKRVVLTSPNWLPGEKNGIKVPMKITYPVHFVIDADVLKANVQQ